MRHKKPSTYICPQYGLQITLENGRIGIDNLPECTSLSQRNFWRFEIDAAGLIGGQRNAAQLLRFWYSDSDIGAINKLRKSNSQALREAHSACTEALDHWIQEDLEAYCFLKDCAVSSDGFIQALTDPKSCFSIRTPRQGFLLKGKHPTYEKIKCLLLDADSLHCVAQLRSNGFEPEIIAASTFDGTVYMDAKPIHLSAKMSSQKLLAKFSKEIGSIYSKLAHSDDRYVYLSEDRIKEHRQIRRKHAIAPGETLNDYCKRLEYAGLDPLAAKAWPESGWIYRSMSEPVGKMVYSASESDNPMGFTHLFEHELFSRVFALIPKGAMARKNQKRSETHGLLTAKPSDHQDPKAAFEANLNLQGDLLC